MPHLKLWLGTAKCTVSSYNIHNKYKKVCAGHCSVHLAFPSVIIYWAPIMCLQRPHQNLHTSRTFLSSVFWRASWSPSLPYGFPWWHSDWSVENYGRSGRWGDRGSSDFWVWGDYGERKKSGHPYMRKEVRTVFRSITVFPRVKHCTSDFISFSLRFFTHKTDDRVMGRIQWENACRTLSSMLVYKKW